MLRRVSRLCYSVYENNEQKLTKLSSITHPVSLYIFYFTKKIQRKLTYFLNLQEKIVNSHGLVLNGHLTCIKKAGPDRSAYICSDGVRT